MRMPLKNSCHAAVLTRAPLDCRIIGRDGDQLALNPTNTRDNPSRRNFFIP